MRTVNIPILALLSAAIPKPCEAFVSLTRGTTAPLENPVNSVQIQTTAGVVSPPFSLRKREILLCSASINIDGADGGNAVDSFSDVESKVLNMKVVELKAELKSYDLPSSGLKKILQQRLLDFYRTANTKGSERENKSNPAGDNNGEVIKEVEEEKKEERETIMEIEEEEDEDSDDEEYDIHDENEDDSDLAWVFSKKRWKKKTFLLMEDVRQLVHSTDAEARKKGPKKAKEALRRMQQWLLASSSYNDEENLDATFDQRITLLKAYNLWIHALAKSGYDDAGYQAEEVLNEMRQNASNGGPSPNDVTIASVMDAHAHSASVSSSSSGGAKAAESFLFRLLEKHEANNNNIPWSQDGNNALRDSLIVTCDTMLNAWAREGTMDSAERALVILLRLEEYQRQMGKQQKKARSKQKKASTSTRKVRPISYSTVMNGWANVRSAEAAEKAEATLDSLVVRAKVDKKEKSNDNGEQSKLVSIQPDTILFNSVIQCWAASRNRKAGDKSLQLLKQMKELAGVDRGDNNVHDDESIYFDTHPDIITYNTILSAWSHCGDKNAAPQAEKIVKELVMEQEKRRKQQIDSENSETNTSVVVNTVTFNTVLDAWSKSKLPGATDRAGNLLEYMIQSKDPQILPDIYSFTCVMDALAKSKEPNKASQTRDLLDRSIQMHQEALRNGDKRKADALRLTQVPYNTVLNACAFSALRTPEEEKREAIRIAVDIYKAMSSRRSLSSFRRKGNGSIVARDTVTYGIMLKSIANLMPFGTVRNQMALQIFQECCNDGLVGFMAWNEVRRAVPIKILQEACMFKRQIRSLEVKDLPKEWTKNCRERKRFTKQRQMEQNDRRKKKKSKSTEKEPAKAFIIERSYATGKDM